MKNLFNKSPLQLLCISILLLLLIAIDIVTKYIAVATLTAGPIYINPWLNLILGYNSGISFGIFNDGSAVNRYILITVTSCISLFILYLLLRERRVATTVAYTLILSGAIGNLIDRLSSRQAVVDFIDFHLGDWHWPAFNFADTCITIGATLFLIDTLLQFKHERSAAK